MSNKMKRLIYSLIVVASILLPVSMFASPHFSTNVHEEFDVNKNCSFEILNRNGNITIENTSDDHITIDAYIVGKARSTSESEKICSKIKVSIEMVDDKVLVKSDIPSNLKSSDFELNYEVIMPSYLNLNLMNKYGNVTIDKLLGKTSIKVSYGMLKINKLDDQTNSFPVIDLAYSNGSSIDEIAVGGINLAYSDITIHNGRALAISSKYSNYTVDKLSSIAIESSYDNITVNNVEKADISSRYSRVDVDRVESLAHIELSYGSLRIGSLSQNFTDVDLSSRYADVNLGVAGLASYSADLYTKYGDINCPKLNNCHFESTSSTKSMKGNVGMPADSKKIKIHTQYGKISVK